MKAHAQGAVEIELTDTQVCRLLHTGSGVVKEQKQRAITLRVSPFGREGREKSLHVSSFEEASLRRRRPLGWGR